MPELGEIRKGRDIGYANPRAKFIWYACPSCFMLRWVAFNNGQPSALYCMHCHVTPKLRKQLSRIRTQYYRDHPRAGQKAYERMTTPEAQAKSVANRIGWHMTEKQRWALTIRMRSHNPWRGKKHSEETKQKMRQPRSEHFREIRRILASNQPPKSEATRAKLRASLAKPEVKAIMREKARARTWGADNPHWLGGISFTPYSPEFNERLKVQIRQRDSYQCQLCSRIEGKRCFNVHHIDYDKTNCVPSNLVTLCISCHSKTSHHRKYWQDFFMKLMEVKFNVKN